MSEILLINLCITIYGNMNNKHLSNLEGVYFYGLKGKEGGR